MAKFDRVLGAIEIAEALDDFRGVFRGRENGGKWAGGPFAGEPVFGISKQDFAETENRAEGIIKIVRDPAGQGAEGRKPLHLPLGVFQFGERFSSSNRPLAHI